MYNTCNIPLFTDSFFQVLMPTPYFVSQNLVLNDVTRVLNTWEMPLDVPASLIHKSFENRALIYLALVSFSFLVHHEERTMLLNKIEGTPLFS